MIATQEFEWIYEGIDYQILVSLGIRICYICHKPAKYVLFDNIMLCEYCYDEDDL